MRVPNKDDEKYWGEKVPAGYRFTNAHIPFLHNEYEKDLENYINSFLESAEPSREEMYNRVNQCETLEQLAQVIESLADENGLIQGRTRLFNAEKMSNFCRNFDEHSPNVLTREFGIRQQAMYISYYVNKGL